MRIHSFITLAFCLAAGAASAAPLRPGTLRDSSWGKPNVPLDRYWLDGAECALQAVDLDVAQTEPAKRLIAASRELDEAADTMWMDLGSGLAPLTWGNYGLNYARTYAKYRPELQFDAVRDIQLGTLDACLARRGYTHFALTDAQQKELRHLRRGSIERRLYLHRLGSDPEVLERQRL